MIDVLDFITNVIHPIWDLADRKDICVSREEEKVTPDQNFPGTLTLPPPNSPAAVWELVVWSLPHCLLECPFQGPPPVPPPCLEMLENVLLLC